MPHCRNNIISLFLLDSHLIIYQKIEIVLAIFSIAFDREQGKSPQKKDVNTSEKSEMERKDKYVPLCYHLFFSQCYVIPSLQLLYLLWSIAHMLFI